MADILRWTGGIIATLIAIAVIALFIIANSIFNKGMAKGAVEKTVTSRDGTTIAYEQTGSGPAVVMVSAALADRVGSRALSERLSGHFTVINYDRRGRGKSADTQPYAPSREVEDIEALIGLSGAPVFIFGSSSGAVLALDAASKLSAKVSKVFLYEPPFIVDSSRPPMPAKLATEIAGLVSRGHRDDAVKTFFTEGMGIPPQAVTFMRLVMPGWSKMAGIAHTLPYDLAILSGTQDGKPLPASRWTGAPSTLVMVGSRSEAFFHTGAKELAAILPRGEYKTLEGRDHSAVMISPGSVAGAVQKFFY